MIDTISRLKQYIDISDEDAADIEAVGRLYPWRLTGYYASLIDPADETCPVRLQAVPHRGELDGDFGAKDPLAEEAHSPVPGVIRVYPDRIAVVVTNRCPVYCRHCLRKHSGHDGAGDLRGERLEAVLDYIGSDPGIRDVLLTGGDPLMLSDDELDGIIGAVASVPHVGIVRIGTRTPCTWPERVTSGFADMLASHHPVWLSTQFNHPRELTDESAKALDRLLTKGIPVNNQSVLLRGINDDPDVMIELVRALVAHRVRPYYLYQAQTLSGTGHYVVSIEKGLDIIRKLRGWTTGFAVPQYVLDTPYGKIPLNPDYLMGRDGDYVEMRSFRGEVWREYNPLSGTG